MSSTDHKNKSTSTEARLLTVPSNPESVEATASSSIQTAESVQKPQPSVPRSATFETGTEAREKQGARKVLSKSFRALSSKLGLSIITRSFKSKFDTPSEQTSRPDAASDGNGDTEWADIVDNVVESDSESADSYVEFMRRRGFGFHGGRFNGFGRRKRGEQRDNDDEDVVDVGSVPWFGPNS